MSSSITQRRSFTARSSAFRSAMSVADAGDFCQDCSSIPSSVRTFSSFALSEMRADLISRIVILSISSPKETGTAIRDMEASDENAPEGALRGGEGGIRTHVTAKP